MSQDEVFISAKALSEIWCKYVEAISKEIGRERALDILTRVCEDLALHQAQVIREQTEMQFNAKTAYTVFRDIAERALGVSPEILEESPEKVRGRVDKCPVYEACQLWGIDVESICRAGLPRFMDATLKHLNPRLSYRCFEYRSDVNDHCEHAILLGES